MPRLALLTALAAALIIPVAAQPTAVVLTETPDGLVATPATETPVEADGAALVMRTEEGGWTLRTLDAGDVPADLVRQPLPGVVERALRLGSPLARPALDLARMYTRELSAPPAVEVRLRGRVTGDAASVLARLAEAEGLRELAAETDAAGQTQVDATFGFDSMDEWAAWTAAPATQALLSGLANRTSTLRARPDGC